MAELVAVNNYFTVLDMQALKREALMFDQIAVTHLDGVLAILRELTKDNPSVVAEYEWLCEQGLLINIIHDKKAKISDKEYRQVKSSAKKHGAALEKVMKNSKLGEVLNFADEGVPVGIEKAFAFMTANLTEVEQVFQSEELLTNLAGTHDYYTRAVSIELRETKGLDTYPVLLKNPPPPKHSESATSSDVIEVALNALPIPDENTTWEQIFEFRLDPDSRHKFLALKNWANDVAKTSIRANEVTERLEYLIGDYRRHMENHKIKTKLATIRTIVLAEIGLMTSGWLSGLGAIPAIAGMLAAPLYSIKQMRVSLLDEEGKAPGKEIAYIIKAQQEFSN